MDQEQVGHANMHHSQTGAELPIIWEGENSHSREGGKTVHQANGRDTAPGQTSHEVFVSLPLPVSLDTCSCSHYHGLLHTWRHSHLLSLCSGESGTNVGESQDPRGIG